MSNVLFIGNGSHSEKNSGFFFVRYRPVKLFQNINNKLALDTLDKKNETKIDRSAGPGQMKVDIPRMSKNN